MRGGVRACGSEACRGIRYRYLLHAVVGAIGMVREWVGARKEPMSPKILEKLQKSHHPKKNTRQLFHP